MKEEFDIDEVGTSFDDWLEHGDEWFKKDHLFYHWFNKITENWYWPFPYAHHVIYSEPQLIISHFYYEVKYGFQRMFRGWDDKVLWSVDIWLTNVMVEALPEYIKNHIGTPMTVYPDRYEPNHPRTENDDKVDLEAQNKWDDILKEILVGFQASKRIQEHDYEFGEYNELLSISENGLELFSKYYFDLWD